MARTIKQMVIGFHGIDFGIWTLSYICDSNKMMKFGGDCLSTTEKKSFDRKKIDKNLSLITYQSLIEWTIV
ncbi:S-adenosylmethionine synthase isoform type-1, variant 2 [Dermatophagoides farinae]|uniref:S-adenosylmethionine synthase isoform type-1, variant 2 n=1 Tax=Dermatophagoides farinae TaxID=6954 RepID=A0A922HNQ9_DERFA|nr:S-adenosylmethionine synthase isoform type-1, variant 2 [Dermatophagoides farinae]